MRTLIGVDGSAGSYQATSFVARLLPESSEVFLYYAPPSIALQSPEPVESQLRERLGNWLTRAVFDEARARLPESLQPRTLEIVGARNPAEGLLMAADEKRADLLVVGARGCGSLKEPSLGSVTRTLAHHASIPVLIVRNAPEAHRPLRILLAREVSQTSRQLSEVMSQFHWPTDSTSRIITVIEQPGERMPAWLEDRLSQEAAEAIGLGHFEPTPEERQRVAENVLRWCGELPSSLCEEPPLVAVGDPRREISNALQSDPSDLVVVGMHHGGQYGRLRLGKVPEYLLTHAPCSILLLPHHPQP